MARVKGRNTGPELFVRRTLHAMGYRFRLQGRGLPGRPDVVFSRRRAVVLVHGCFWHAHDCARGGRMPKANRAYWSAKLAANQARDERALDALAAQGWRVLTIWECELGDVGALGERLAAFLGPPRLGRPPPSSDPRSREPSATTPTRP